MQAFEIGHLGGIARLDQGFKAATDQLDQTAAQDDLLAEQIGFAFFLEVGLDDAGAAAADGRRVRQAQVMGIARGILVHRDQAGHAAALEIFAAHGVAGALGGDHQYVQVGARLDQLEMDIEAVGEQERGALLHVVLQFVLVDVGLQLIRRGHHHHVRPFGGVGDAHHLEAGGFRLLGAGARAHGDHKVFHARIPHILGMGMALRTKADDGDLLVLDQIEIGIPIIIHAHKSLTLPGGCFLLENLAHGSHLVCYFIGHLKCSFIAHPNSRTAILIMASSAYTDRYLGSTAIGPLPPGDTNFYVVCSGAVTGHLGRE